MPVAEFGNLPPLKNRHLWALLFVGSKWEAEFELLMDCYYSLPLPFKSLFSFNTEMLVYQRFGILGKIFGNKTTMAVTSFFEDNKKATIYVYKIYNRNTCYKVLLHELAHTLDPCDYGKRLLSPQKHFPDWLYEVANTSEWQDILKQEPDPTENFGVKNVSASHIRWMSKPEEQWACRLAITLTIDYLFPAGLVKSDDILVSGGKMSLTQFLLFYPRSYQYFHKYIEAIFAHVPKK